MYELKDLSEDLVDLIDRTDDGEALDETDQAYRVRLLELDSELDDALSDGAYNDIIWIHKDDWIDYVKDYAESVMAVEFRESNIEWYVDWSGWGEAYLLPDFNETEFEGETYYWKDYR